MNNLDFLQPKDGRPLMPGLVIGKVTANYDEKHKGMVQVAFYSYQEGANKTNWMRVISPAAGKGRGFYCLPEVGDEVLVAFIGQDIDHPCVIGSLWNDTDIYPKEAVSEDNRIKTFVTASGMELRFNEQKGKESIEIHTPKKLTIRLEDEKETIEIRDSAGKNRITVNSSQGKVEIQSAHSMTVQAEDIQLKAGNSLKMTAGQIELKANAGMKLEASGVLQVKGSMVKLNG